MTKTSPPTEVIRQAAGEEQLLVQAAELQVTSGPDRGKRAGLQRGTALVGTDPDCDLQLSDPAVSRRQFEIEATAQGFVIRDLGSTNGTFLDKLRLREVVVTSSVQVLVGRTRIRFEPKAAQESFPLSPRQRFGELLGQSPAMRHCIGLLERAAATTSTVLIEGESGTGKEVAAESLHQLSPRSEGPFVIADCGAIAANLIESELFGHEKGAFTGAVAAHAGALERADGGTLLLDEIGELTLDLQPKLLRFLEKREIRRVGASSNRTVDVRVLAATNRSLEEMVKQGRFREDLYFRLAVLRVRLPALRHRREDIPLLALELARQIRPDADPRTWLDARSLEVLGSHDWPGNVRELRNVLERLAAIPEWGAEGVLEGSGGDDPAAVDAASALPYHQAKERVLDAFERRYLARLLDLEEGVVARAAARAGVPRQTLFRLIRKHGLRHVS